MSSPIPSVYCAPLRGLLAFIKRLLKNHHDEPGKRVIGVACNLFTFGHHFDSAQYYRLLKQRVAAYAPFAGVERESFRWSAGQDGLKTYASSETIDRVFCSNCGSQLLVYFKPEPDVVYLTMGTVDGDPERPPRISPIRWFQGTLARDH